MALGGLFAGVVVFPPRLDRRQRGATVREQWPTVMASALPARTCSHRLSIATIVGEPSTFRLLVSRTRVMNGVGNEMKNVP
jgi:hypothetical protein